MMRFRGFVLIIWLECLNLLVLDVKGVVVDGSKKKGLSALKIQKADESLAIDAYNTKTCGLSDPNAQDHEFINMAREGQFPWIVSLQIKILQDASVKEQKKVAKESKNKIKLNRFGEIKKMEDLHFCSGAFISDRWILSAAHCFIGDTIRNYFLNDKLKIVAGSHRVSSRHRLNKNLTIERIYYHSKFNKSLPIGYDVALVELREPVKFSTHRHKDEYGEQDEPYMNTVCLPLEGKKYSFNETARIAGWGLSSEKDVNTMPSKLLTTDILISDQEQCVKDYEKALKSDAPGRQKKEEDDFICASYKKTRDACQSDSGGPLIQYVNKKAVAIGVVSYGIGCATKGVPGLYTRTAAYIDWIKSITMHKTDARVDFRVYERSKSETKLVESDHRALGTTTTVKPPPPSEANTLTTEAPDKAPSGSTTTSRSSPVASGERSPLYEGGEDGETGDDEEEDAEEY